MDESSSAESTSVPEPEETEPAPVETKPAATTPEPEEPTVPESVADEFVYTFNESLGGMEITEYKGKTYSVSTDESYAYDYGYNDNGLEVAVNGC